MSFDQPALGHRSENDGDRCFKIAELNKDRDVKSVWRIFEKNADLDDHKKTTSFVVSRDRISNPGVHV